MNRIIFYAGWKDTTTSWKGRFGKWWIWIGPYVIGDVRSF